MPLPRTLARFNRRFTNRFLGPIVARLPGFGHVVHVGRRSGREYRTPMLAFHRGDTIVLALTYGPGSDWTQNVVAAGRCRFETRRHALELAAPRLVHDSARRAVRLPARMVLRLLGAADFLELRVVGRQDRSGRHT